MIGSKFGLSLLLMPVLLLPASCYKLDIDHVFREDGSAIISTRAIINKHHLPLDGFWGALAEEGGDECDLLPEGVAMNGKVIKNGEPDFETFQDLATEEVSLTLTWGEIRGDCVFEAHIEVPSGGLADSFTYETMRGSRMADGRWNVEFLMGSNEASALTGDENTEFDQEADTELESAQINLSITLPGKPGQHNAERVSSSGDSTKFVWDYKGITEINEGVGVTHFADTEPAPDDDSTPLWIPVVPINDDGQRHVSDCCATIFV